MNIQSMTVDPNELVIDLPVSEAKVAEYMESLEEHGLIQRITVWLRDNRIIDGFHRAVAAARLGWESVAVDVVDCTEEQFWNARIISARQHHEVEDERLAVWIFECWKQTKWYVPIKPDKDGQLPRAYSNSGMDFTLLEMVWTVFRKKRKIGLREHQLESYTPDEEQLVIWMDARAKQWGVSAVRIADAVLDQGGIKRGYTDKDTTYDRYAQKYNLDFRKTLKFQDVIRKEHPDSEGYARYLARIDADDPGTFANYLSDDETGKRDKDATKRHPPPSVAVVSHVPTQRQSDEGAAAYRARASGREKRQHVLAMMKEMRNWVRSLEPSLQQVEDGQVIFAAFVTDMAHTHERLWPSKATGSETVDLHNKIHALEQQLDSYRRALGTKEGLHITGDHIALTSSQVKFLGG